MAHLPDLPTLFSEVQKQNVLILALMYRYVAEQTEATKLKLVLFGFSSALSDHRALPISSDLNFFHLQL